MRSSETVCLKFGNAGMLSLPDLQRSKHLLAINAVQKELSAGEWPIVAQATLAPSGREECSAGDGDYHKFSVDHDHLKTSARGS